MSEQPTIDSGTIENLRALGGDGDDFLAEIVGIFLSDTPVRLAELETGLAAADRDTFLRAAHSIKGSAANLGALRLQAAAERLELQARQIGEDGIAPLMDSLRDEFAVARRELEALLRH